MKKTSPRIIFLLSVTVAIGIVYAWPGDPIDPILRCFMKCLWIEDPFEQNLCVNACCSVCI